VAWRLVEGEGVGEVLVLLLAPLHFRAGRGRRNLFAGDQAVMGSGRFQKRVDDCGNFLSGNTWPLALDRQVQAPARATPFGRGWAVRAASAITLAEVGSKALSGLTFSVRVRYRDKSGSSLGPGHPCGTAGRTLGKRKHAVEDLERGPGESSWGHGPATSAEATFRGHRSRRHSLEVHEQRDAGATVAPFEAMWGMSWIDVRLSLGSGPTAAGWGPSGWWSLEKMEVLLGAEGSGIRVAERKCRGIICRETVKGLPLPLEGLQQLIAVKTGVGRLAGGAAGRRAVRPRGGGNGRAHDGRSLRPSLGFRTGSSCSLFLRAGNRTPGFQSKHLQRARSLNLHGYMTDSLSSFLRAVAQEV